MTSLRGHQLKLAIAVAGFALAFLANTLAFEGRITAVTIRGNQRDVLLYTIDTNSLRVEMTATNWPNPVDILDRNSGELTLLFPNNRSFVRLKPAEENSSPMPPGFPPMPGGSPPGVAVPPGSPGVSGIPPGPAPANFPVMPMMPAGLPPSVGPQAQNPKPPGVSAMPTMPAAGGMPSMPPIPTPGDVVELKSTNEKTNLLGFACEKFEIKQRGETMDIWATGQLPPFQSYVRTQPHRIGPRMLEQQWPELLKAGKLFPLLVSLKYNNGLERFRFEVTSVTPQKLTDEDAARFQPPPGYFEIQPLPF
jgi:hypothetical protein